MAVAVLQTAVMNHKGLVRGNNEDNFYLDGTFIPRDRVDEGARISRSCKNPYQLYAVCDGMGGADSGEEASYCAVKELASIKNRYSELKNEETLTAFLRKTSEKVYDEAEVRGQRSGTTIAMALVDGNKIHVSNVGDSRVYRYQKGILTQVSLDHSKVQRLISMGVMTPEQARTDPERHKINQYLGMPKEVRVSPHIDPPERLRKGDIYILCSDGLTDMVEDHQIEEIVKSGKDASEIAERLIKAALKRGGKDNVTVMVLQVMNVLEENETEKTSSIRTLSRILTGAQVVVGGGFLLTLADLIYFLAHR